MGYWIHSGSLGLTQSPKCCRIHSVSRGFTRAHIGVARFFRVRVGSFGYEYGSPGLFRFGWVNYGALIFWRINSDSDEFSCARHGIIGLIWVRVVSLRRR